jgi:hypothetical protein
MVKFSIQAPPEQINPTDLLNDVIMMEWYVSRNAGPATIICLGCILGLRLVQLALGLGQRLPKQIG